MSADDILATIAARRLSDVLASRAAAPLPSAPPPPAFATPRVCLRSLLSSGPAIAAEFKRASPSKGALAAADADAASAAAGYAAGGAAILSVLTEPHWFRGSLADLTAARLAAEAWAGGAPGRCRPALLRKDFVVDACQLAEAAAAGADAALLIVSLQPDVALLGPLISAAAAAGVEPLVEVNSTAELEVALAAGARVLGVNNRNLRTFAVDLGTTARVVAAAALWPRARRRVAGGADADAELAVLSLSGLRAGDDIAPLVEDCVRATAAVLRGAGAGDAADVASESRALVRGVLRGFLIGEALMRSPEPIAAVADFVAATAVAFGGGGGGAAAAAAAAPPPLVKICGLREEGDAVHAARSGADLVGIILVPGAARAVEPGTVGAGISRAVGAFREQDPTPSLAALLPPLSAAVPPLSPAAALRALAPRAALLRAAARRARPLVVGVCMDAPLGEALAAAAAARVDLLQLHGREDPAAVGAAYAAATTAAALAAGAPPPPFIKVLHIATDGLLGEAPASLARALLAWATAGAAALILDSAAAGSAAGGTGCAFAHAEALTAIARALDAAVGADAAGVDVPVLLAGGLAPGTVADAIASVTSASAPRAGGGCRIVALGVDVSSGVEAPGGPKGRKDRTLIDSFIAAAKAQR